MEIEHIYYKHWRYFDKEQNDDSLLYMNILRPYTRRETEWQPTARGGKTECHLVLSDGTEIVGTAECSKKDNFNYSIGRQIAHGRAVKKYQKMLHKTEDYTYGPYTEYNQNLMYAEMVQ
jgi:hypothetical protein